MVFLSWIGLLDVCYILSAERKSFPLTHLCITLSVYLLLKFSSFKEYLDQLTTNFPSWLSFNIITILTCVLSFPFDAACSYAHDRNCEMFHMPCDGEAITISCLRWEEQSASPVNRESVLWLRFKAPEQRASNQIPP